MVANVRSVGDSLEFAMRCAPVGPCPAVKESVAALLLEAVDACQEKGVENRSSGLAFMDVKRKVWVSTSSSAASATELAAVAGRSDKPSSEGGLGVSAVGPSWKCCSSDGAVLVHPLQSASCARGAEFVASATAATDASSLEGRMLLLLPSAVLARVDGTRDVLFEDAFELPLFPRSKPRSLSRCSTSILFSSFISASLWSFALCCSNS
mmetsp:Transcript_116385/g.232042  ORF Transcript_116385/g.232042 Transcript_116385/m.232042 type:complete len:209 (-) Transcript_116385:979-1605(-)